MVDVLEKFLTDETKEYELNNAIFDSIKKEINDNKSLIKKANELDFNYNKNAINFERLSEIVENYKKYPMDKKSQNKVVVYTGDPYLTLELLMQALKSHDRVLLAFNEYMFGTNEVILSIFYQVLNQYKIKNLVYNITKVSAEFLSELNNIENDVVVIGDTTFSQLLNNCQFYPYKNYVLYSDNDELEMLKQAIYRFTTEYEYELEILYEDNIDDVISEVNNSNADHFILLSTNERSKERVKNEVKDKKIFINENPFKDKNEEIRLYL